MYCQKTSSEGQERCTVRAHLELLHLYVTGTLTLNDVQYHVQRQRKAGNAVDLGKGMFTELSAADSSSCTASSVQLWSRSGCCNPSLSTNGECTLSDSQQRTAISQATTMKSEEPLGMAISDRQLTISLNLYAISSSTCVQHRLLETRLGNLFVPHRFNKAAQPTSTTGV